MELPDSDYFREEDPDVIKSKTACSIRLTQLNKSICQMLVLDGGAALIRFGNTEADVIYQLLHAIPIADGYRPWVEYNAGIYPFDNYFLRNGYLPYQYAAYLTADIIGFVSDKARIYFNRHFPRKEPIFSYSWSDGYVLEPNYISGKDLRYPCENPWTKSLVGKKVIFVTPFVNTALHQWQRREKLWGDLLEKICPFELVGLVQTPFCPAVSGVQVLDRNHRPMNTWIEVLMYLFEKIQEFDYDVAFIGAGSYAPAIASFVKLCGKKAITTCGSTQLFFGVWGNRWDDTYRGLLDNKYWLTTPLPIDIPKNAHLINQRERAYW